MKINKISTIFAIVASVALFTACSNASDKTEASKSSAVTANNTAASASSNCMQSVKTASINSGKVQIDDMVFTVGGSVNEVFEALAQSKNDYEYDKTPTTEIAKGQGIGVDFIIKKNGKDYLHVEAYNYQSGVADLKDCTVDKVYVSDEGNANFFYAGGISAGMSFDEISKIFAGCKESRHNAGSGSYTTRYSISDSLSIELEYDSKKTILQSWKAIFVKGK